MLAFLRSRLAVRLAALFLLVSLAPILGAALLLPRVFEDSARAEMARRHDLLAERCGALIEEHVERARAKLRTVARLFAEDRTFGLNPRSAKVATRERDLLVQRLQGLVDPADAFLELQYYAGGEQPEIIGQARQALFDAAQSANPDHDARNQAQILSNVNAPLVLAPLNEGKEWRDEKLVDIEGYRTLLLSTPVLRPEVGGALVAYVDFAPLEARLATLAGEDYALEARDAQGTVLGAVGGVNAPLASSERVAAGWSITVHESTERLEAEQANLARQTRLWVLFAVAIAIAASLGLSAWITRPIARLERAAEELARGNFAASAGLERADEIGRLGAAFDRMAGALNELDRAKSEFVANVSHELRTPLTSLKLSVANLLDGVVGAVPPGQRATLERVQGELERLIRLVNELLEMARLDAGASEPKRERIELVPLAREVVAALEPLASEHAITLEIDGAGAVRADRSMLQRVLMNLLDNAIKFSPARSKVRIVLASNGFRVQDQGPGIETSFLFEAFRQGKQHGVKNPGAGLGLAIVRKLVELNDGQLRVESGAGAGLVVELPPA